MTVSTTNSTQLFSGGQQNLTFTFRAVPGYESDIKLIERVTATGQETRLVYNTDYTVTINTSGIGGTVRVNPTYATTYTQVVKRESSLTQSSDYDDYSQFPANTLETDIDRLTLMAQEQADDIADVSNKVTAWVTFDGTGSNPITPTAVYATSSSVIKNGTGDYTVFFVPTFSNTNYAVIISGGGTTNFLGGKIKDGTTTSTQKITISTINTSFAAVDTKYITVAILKN